MSNSILSHKNTSSIIYADLFLFSKRPHDIFCIPKMHQESKAKQRTIKWYSIISNPSLYKLRPKCVGLRSLIPNHTRNLTRHIDTRHEIPKHPIAPPLNNHHPLIILHRHRRQRPVPIQTKLSGKHAARWGELSKLQLPGRVINGPCL